MEKVSDSAASLEKKPSLEEPLTLSHEEVKSLRDAAIEVINTHTKEEAETIFLAGLKPIKVAPKEGSTQKVLGKRSRR